MEPTQPTLKREPDISQGIPQSPSKKDESLSTRLIRTMRNDAAEAIKKQNETFVSIALAEEKKQTLARAEALAEQAALRETARQAPKPRGRMILVIVFLIVIVALGLAYQFILPKFSALQIQGISLSSFGLSSSGKAPEPPAGQKPAPIAPALITPQYEKRFILNKETPEHLFATIAVERTAGVILGAINNLYFTEETATADGTTATTVISARRLLSFANIHAPEILARSLETPFMAGLLGEAESSATPFLILKISSYESGLAGMLVWETSLPRLFDTIFGTNTQASDIGFRDIIVSGKDARVLYAGSRIAVIYSFANPDTIVIAGSRSALEILLPLAAK